ncbi:glycerol-3-phosphate 1-O-acyltransferase PlsY [Eubacteriales bacterium OttesenSCG-928-A19]|nr:glycerol-3-phosphate 1-O-acyltransferase PlsY [Eubacteriales bacterium OttesenSCG-928-A19]
MAIMRWILCAAIGYLLGNIQTGLLVARLSGEDLRKHGSGSSGATNALRVLGRRSAIITFVGDLLKGVIASAIGIFIAGTVGGMFACVFVVVGHIWPVFFGFKGGKGAATSIGALFVILPVQTLVMLVVGVAVVFITKMVSLGSIVGALTLLLIESVSSIISFDPAQLIFIVIMVALIVYAHRENIDRIRKGTENKISGDMFRKR